MIKAVVFDLDNTLFDMEDFSLPALKNVSAFVSKKYGFDEKAVYNVLLRLWKVQDPVHPHFFDDLAAELGIKDTEAVDGMLKAYRASRPKITLYRGVHLMLEKMKKKYKIGLITDGHPETQKYKLSVLGITDLFDAVVFSGADRNNEKPSIAPYLEMLEKLKVRPQEMVYIGDNPYKDFSGAKSLGIRTVRVLTGIFKGLKVGANQDAERTIKNLGELIPLLEELV